MLNVIVLIDVNVYYVIFFLDRIVSYGVML